MKVVEMKIDDVKPYENNPRNNEQAVQGVANSIQQFGWQQPIVVDKENIIIVGHTRYKAAQKLGLKVVPVVVAELSEEKAKAYRLADNKTNEAAEWNFDKLQDELIEIINIDMSDFGFDVDNIINDLQESNGDSDNEAKQGLKEKFIFTPTSVLDSRCGDWQKRKRMWFDIGIKSDGSRETMKTSGSLSGTTPYYYAYKNKTEQKIGYKISNKEFEEKYLSKFINKSSTIAHTNTGGILSVFDPVLCELMYTWFSFDGAKIIDPFAGGSVRGIVASIMGQNYTGIDIRQSQINENNKQKNEILSDEYKKPVWICGDSVNIKNLAPDQYDFIFSCPPYFDLEIYSDNEKDLSNMCYDDFLKSYRKIINDAVSMLKDDRFACFVVGDIRNKKCGGFIRGFVPDTIKAFEDAGAHFYNEIILLTCAGSLPLRVGRQFQSSRKIGKQHQNILVFYKGNPKNIKKNYGNVKINEEIQEKTQDYI